MIDRNDAAYRLGVCEAERDKYRRALESILHIVGDSHLNEPQIMRDIRDQAGQARRPAANA